jgi:hypothetical protein
LPLDSTCVPAITNSLSCGMTLRFREHWRFLLWFSGLWNNVVWFGGCKRFGGTRYRYCERRGSIFIRNISSKLLCHKPEDHSMNTVVCDLISWTYWCLKFLQCFFDNEIT